MGKLADFTIFLMKLVQRLEAQSFQNLSSLSDPKIKEMLRDLDYQKGRQSHIETPFPENPDDFITKLLKGPADGAFIDQTLMPSILSMAKMHVEGINRLYQGCVASTKPDKELDELKARIESFESLKSEHKSALEQVSKLEQRVADSDQAKSQLREELERVQAKGKARVNQLTGQIDLLKEEKSQM